MSRGGYSWHGGGVVEATRSLNVMQLRRAGFLAGWRHAGWRWTYRDGTSATIDIEDGRTSITLGYSVKFHDHDWHSVVQQVPIRWALCRLGGERPWFVCDVHANGVYCGRRVTKLYGAGRLFACRHCYGLGYLSQRGGPLDRTHRRLARLHAKLDADYDGPDMPSPPKPKWMRWATYCRIVRQLDAARDLHHAVFMAGAERILARLDRAEYCGRSRR